ncbi:DUF7504 family protein [Halohasta salina]|uniref:DUF7504 family protein n=1 Tax=Halohasta salina TaxID=2961621 RepID=UPI0020A4048D|nr:hypothetical protein [Halohasta salina]
MSNESEPDDEEPIDDARIDAFLDRLEDDEPVDETPAATTGGSDNTDAVTGGGGNRSAADKNTGDARPQPDEAADPEDRLWDSFGSSTDPETDAEPTADGKPPNGTEAGEPTTTDAGEPDTNGPDWSTPAEPSDTGSAGTTEPTDRQTGGAGTDVAEQATDFEFGTEPAATSGDERGDESDVDGGDDGGGSSFRSVLDRISHRVTGGEADTDRDDTGRSAGSASRSTQADTIDQILNNIDAFGRATASSQVLLLSPTAHSITNEIYRRFLVPDDGSGQNVLFVSATGTVDDQLAAAEEVPAWAGGKTAVIEVGRSGLRPSEPGAGPDPTRRLDIYKNISNLKHLAKLGVNISHIVSQWDDERRPTVVGVHTLSAIQQYVGNETMFQFLFTLKGQLNSRGVMGFYHMNPRAHTDTELETITSAFDIVIRIGPDGNVDIE